MVDNISAAEFATLASEAYSSRSIGTRIYSWTVQKFYGDPENGFFASVFQSTRTGTIVIAFRGSELEGVDWLSNIGNIAGWSAGQWDSQLNSAMSYFRVIRSLASKGGIAVCGHSLGGFLATAIAMKTGVDGVTFNTAPVGLTRLTPSQGVPRLVNFRMKGDPISALRVFPLGRTIEIVGDHPRLDLGIPQVPIPGPIATITRTVRAGQSAFNAYLDHSMKALEVAILMHEKSDRSPFAW